MNESAEEMYPMFRNCVEMVGMINKEQQLGLTRIGVLRESFNMYAEILRRIAKNASEAESPKSILDMVTWSK